MKLKLKTLVPVTYNDGIASQSTGIVIMELGTVTYQDNFSKIGINFLYKSEDGRPVYSNTFFLVSEEQINQLFELIQPSLPPFTNEVDYTRYKFITGGMYEMARTYNIPVSDIEIVVE